MNPVTSRPFGAPPPEYVNRDALRGVARLQVAITDEAIHAGVGYRKLRCDGLPAFTLNNGVACPPEGIPVNVIKSNGQVYQLPGQLGIGSAGGPSGTVLTVGGPVIPPPIPPPPPPARRFIDLYDNAWDADGNYLGPHSAGGQVPVLSKNEYFTRDLFYWDGLSEPTYRCQSGGPGVYGTVGFDDNVGMTVPGGAIQIGVVGSGGALVVFTGSGLNDASFSASSVLTNGTVFEVEIDGTGSPNTFRWRKNGGSWTSSVTITAGSSQSLSDGVTVTFGAGTGHTAGNGWSATFTSPAGYTGRGGVYLPDTYPNPTGSDPSQLHHDDFAQGPIGSPYEGYSFGMEALNYENGSDPLGLPWRGGYAMTVRDVIGAVVLRDTRFFSGSGSSDYGTSEAATSFANTQYDHWDVWMDDQGNIWAIPLIHPKSFVSNIYFDFTYGADVWQGHIDPVTFAITWGADVTLQAPDWTGIAGDYKGGIHPDLIRTIYVP